MKYQGVPQCLILSRADQDVSPWRQQFIFDPVLCVFLQELREHGEKKKRPREAPGDNDDTEGAIGVRNKVAGGKMKKRKGR